MAYVKSDEFVTIALDLNCDDAAIFKYLTDKFPAYITDRSKIRSRIANYRRKGLLPLASGNVVSTGELLKGTSTLKLGALTSNSYRIIPLIAGNSL